MVKEIRIYYPTHEERKEMSIICRNFIISLREKDLDFKVFLMVMLIKSFSMSHNIDLDNVKLEKR
jgi:hypothetical protein